MIKIEHGLVVNAPIERTYTFVAFMFGSTCRRAFPSMEVSEEGADTLGMPNVYGLTINGVRRDFHVVERTPRDSFTLLTIEPAETVIHRFTFLPVGAATVLTLVSTLTAHGPKAEEYEYHAEPRLRNFVQTIVQRMARAVEEISENIDRGGPDISEEMATLSAMFDLRMVEQRATAGQRTGATEADAIYRPAEQVMAATIHDYVKVMMNGIWYGPVRMTFAPLDADKTKSTAVIKTPDGVWYKLWFYDSHIQPSPE